MARRVLGERRRHQQRAPPRVDVPPDVGDRSEQVGAVLSVPASDKRVAQRHAHARIHFRRLVQPQVLLRHELVFNRYPVPRRRPRLAGVVRPEPRDLEVLGRQPLHRLVDAPGLLKEV